MNDKQEFFDVPKKGGAARKRGGRGFFTHVVWMLVLGFVVLVLALVLVKVSGKGPVLRKTIIALLGGSAAPAPTPAPAPAAKVDPLVVEKVVEVPVEKVVEKIVEKIVEVQPPMPSSYVSWKKVDVAKLWSDIPVKTEVVTTQGGTAVVERERDESYQLEMTLKLTVPKPNQSAAELAAINEHLPRMLKDFDKLVGTAEVSPFYHHLYELKTRRIQQNITRIEEILSRHNLYDLETALQIKHPGTGRKLLLVQGEMDVVSDGSDGDRWPALDDYISMSQFYQPFTSYGWGKKTNVPNPLLARWETRLREYEDEFAKPGLSIERNRYLRENIDTYQLEISDLRARSYLIAEADPFIVIPLSFLGRREENEFGPAIGDYAVVVYGNQLFPAIAGDAGPSWKFGEASLRIARQLNEKASPYNRPISDLEVTYLIFPGSAEETKGPPDLAKWHQKCSTLLEEIGGIGEGYSLHQWEDLIAKKRAEAATAPVSDAAPAPAPATTTAPAAPAPTAPAAAGEEGADLTKPADPSAEPAPAPDSGTQEAGKQVPE
jgi:hypothetical protein